MTLSFRVEGDQIALIGLIDEDARFEEVLGSLPASCALDLREVVGINSTGVREWMGFITDLSAGRDIVLRRCSVVFVTQINIISGFTGRARVESVMAPYVCGMCDAVADRLVDLTAEDVAGQLSLPLPCAQCGAPMLFDDLPDEYLSFASR